MTRMRVDARRPARPAPLPAAAGLAVALAVALAGCQRPPDPPRAGPATPTVSGPAAAASASPRPRPSSPAPPSPTRATPSPTATGFAETTAVPCAGRPTPAAVLDALRRTPGLLPAGVAPTVASGPLCAGSWQYSVVTAPEREPLRVVTRTVGAGLELVTAGTDVCSVDVRAAAPPGILAVARCAGS